MNLRSIRLVTFINLSHVKSWHKNDFLVDNPFLWFLNFQLYTSVVYTCVLYISGESWFFHNFLHPIFVKSFFVYFHNSTETVCLLFSTWTEILIGVLVTSLVVVVGVWAEAQHISSVSFHLLICRNLECHPTCMNLSSF